MPPDNNTRTLSDADIQALTSALGSHNTCNLGLTPDEVSTLKRLLKAFDKAAGIVGKVVLTAIVVFLIGIFTKGFWLTLLEGVSKAGTK